MAAVEVGRLVVRVVGGDPDRQREDVTEEELRDMVAAQSTFTPQQRMIISGAFEVADRTLNEVLRPRRDVVIVDASANCDDAIELLIRSGHSRAPVAPGGKLDETVGIVGLHDLITGRGTAGAVARPVEFFPETAPVLDVLRRMQSGRHQLAVVINEHGGADGIVTVEDLLEEIVGEIYDETDRDILDVVHEDDGALVLPGRFPAHDLPDVGVHLPAGDYATVAGAILTALGHIADSPGDIVEIDGWSAEVLAVENRTITRVRLRRIDGSPGGPERQGDR